MTSWITFQRPCLYFSTSEKTSPFFEIKLGGLKCSCKQHLNPQNFVPLHNYYLKPPSYSHNDIWQTFCKIKVPSGLLLTTGHVDEVSLRSLSYLLCQYLYTFKSNSLFFFLSFSFRLLAYSGKKTTKQQPTNLCMPLMWKRIIFWKRENKDL